MSVVIVGGAGFVGQHCARLVRNPIIYDLANGDDARDIDKLTAVMRDAAMVWHLASNADIAAGAKDPTIDFENGTRVTQAVCEATRRSGAQGLIYFSGSGVYGERHGLPCREHAGPFMPNSPYGASKLAGEGLVAAYAQMYRIPAIILRPANIVGPGQTHGVGLDFIRRLKENPEHLYVRGNGWQTKSYVHVQDVLGAVLAISQTARMAVTVVNVAADDALTVREIATMAAATLGVNPEFHYEESDRGWAGDVPVVTLSCEYLRRTGWEPRYTSREAMQLALSSFV